MNAIIQLIASLFGSVTQRPVALARTPEQDRSLRLLRSYLNEAVPYGKDALRIHDGPLIMEILSQGSSRQDLIDTLPPVSEAEVTDWQNKLRENARLFKKARSGKQADRNAYIASRDTLMQFYEDRYGNYVEFNVLGLKEELVPFYKRIPLRLQDFADGLVEPNLREGPPPWWKKIPGLSCLLYFGAVTLAIGIACVAAIAVGLWSLGLDPVQRGLSTMWGGVTYLWGCSPIAMVRGWFSSLGRVLGTVIAAMVAIAGTVMLLCALGFATHFAWSWYHDRPLPTVDVSLQVERRDPSESWWPSFRTWTEVRRAPAPSRPAAPAFTPGVCPAEILAGDPTRAQVMERIVDYGEAYPRRYHAVIEACRDQVPQ